MTDTTPALAAPLPRPGPRLSHLVPPRAGPARLRLVGERHLPAPQLGPRDRRAPPDHAASRSGWCRATSARTASGSSGTATRPATSPGRGWQPRSSGGTPEPLCRGPARRLGRRPGARARADGRPAISGRDGFALYVTEADGIDAAPAAEPGIDPPRRQQRDGPRRHRARRGLSADERLVAIEHGEHGDLIHPALRVLDARTGAVVADLEDAGKELVAFAWSPVPGDERLAIGHERRGERAPAIWEPRTGRVTDLALPWERLTEVADWWPDGSAVLLVELDDGRDRLHRYDLADGRITALPTTARLDDRRSRPARTEPSGTGSRPASTRASSSRSAARSPS